jgi:hypothetical protein
MAERRNVFRPTFFLLFQESGEVDACHLTFNQNGASSIPFSLIYWIIICQVQACLVDCV